MPFNKSTNYFIKFLHFGFWIALYLVPYFDPRGIHPIFQSKIHFFLNPHILLNHLLFVILFYSNSEVFVPRLLLQNRKIIYFLVVFFLTIVILLVTYLMFPLFKIPHVDFSKPKLSFVELIRFNQTISLIFPLLFILLVSTLYRLLIHKYKFEKKQKEKENEQLKTELLFLRSQISPHFIFNALNSSIILVRKQSEKAEESLIKLASLMRYMLYESDNEKIAIEDEIEYIENYIDLQIIRFEKSIKINKKIVFDETHSSDFIESMLLIPFIENAFKHGSLVLKEPEIEIEISIENNILILITKNKFSTKTNIHGEISKNHGIGLSNVKRRLELLYPNRHELKLDKVGEYFNVYLSIQINQ